jgi:hypothetical protein
MLPQPTRRRFLHATASAGVGLLTSSAKPEQSAGKDKPSEVKRSDASSKGPLLVHSKNSRYFSDDSGKAVYLTGAHTWYNLQDIGLTDPPPPFKFDSHRMRHELKASAEQKEEPPNPFGLPPWCAVAQASHP